jgi:hypothetical protein
MAPGIFDKEPQLRPSTMAAVAERRFGDAEALSRTEENARANGVAYLVGFVIEILLKARLVARFRNTARKRQHEVTDAEREVWRLIWKQHDLEAMLERMPELEAALKRRGERDGRDHLSELKKVCATWTIQARYSPRTINMAEAREWLERARSLKELLK